MTTAILLQTLVSIAIAVTPVAEEGNAAKITSPAVVEATASNEISTPTPTPTTAPQFVTYITQTGDTVRRIAKEHYGSEVYWVQIWNDNPELEDPAVIHPGVELTLRTAQQTDVEELARALPTPTQTVTPTLAPSPTIGLAQEMSTEQIGSPVGNFAKAYEDAGNTYGIPWQILSAIHQVETGRRDGPIGSGNAPQGPMQFMPGTWTVHGVDGDGDGNADINNAVDAIHSAANYLSKYDTIEQGLDAYGRIKDDVLTIARSLGYNG